MPRFGWPEIQLPVLCELPFVEMWRNLFWITRCLLTWVRTRRASDMTRVAHHMTNSVLISRTSFLMKPSFFNKWRAHYVSSLFYVRPDCSEWARSAMYHVPPQETQFRPTGVALPLAADFWWVLSAEQWQLLCLSTSCVVPSVPTQSSRLMRY